MDAKIKILKQTIHTEYKNAFQAIAKELISNVKQVIKAVQ